jgi:RNA polymerase sigma-70 factor (ECF subfamily)
MKDDSEHCEPFPERETIRRALRGDDLAFRDLVVLYGRRLYAVAYGVVQDAGEAEDVVQETFLRAFTRRSAIREPDAFPAWLFQTARNRALDLRRKHRPQLLDPAEAPLEEIPDPGVPPPGANLHELERNGAVHRLLDSLPENHRIAITLRFMEGMDYRQIEETMGINPGTVRGLLSRAMKTLRKGIGAGLTGVNP